MSTMLRPRVSRGNFRHAYEIVQHMASQKMKKTRMYPPVYIDGTSADERTTACTIIPDFVHEGDDGMNVPLMTKSLFFIPMSCYSLGRKPPSYIASLQKKSAAPSNTENLQVKAFPKTRANQHEYSNSKTNNNSQVLYLYRHTSNASPTTPRDVQQSVLRRDKDSNQLENEVHQTTERLTTKPCLVDTRQKHYLLSPKDRQ